MEEFTATIHSQREVALKTYEVTFKLGGPLFFEAGQSIEVCVAETACIDKRSDCQKLPIVSSPNSNKLVTIVIRDSSSCFERALLELPVGAKVTVRGPVGVFSLPADAYSGLVFIAEGMGIASFFGMCATATERKLSQPITLLYANATRKQSLYINELRELADKNHFFTCNVQSSDIDASSIKDAVDTLTGKRWYVAGSPAFILSVLYLLREMGIQENRILHEEVAGYGNKLNLVNQRIVSVKESKPVEAVEVPVSNLEELKENTSNLEQIIAEMKVKEAELENTKKAILNILEDLDEEKRAVERRVEERTAEIKREKEKLQQVTKNIKDGVILLDTTGSAIFANEGLYQLFNLDPVKVTTTTVLSEICTYFSGTTFKDSLARCLSGEVFTLGEIESQGKIFEIFFNNLQVKSDGKEEVNYFILVTDITDAKLLERSKSELVAVASHQLRTPLTAVRGNIEMLIDESYGPLNPEQRELLSDVDISTARLIGMVNDMLDITKIERGNLDMVLEQVSIKEVIESICSDLFDYAKRRGVVLEIAVADNTMVYADKSRVRQVMQNLIDNSVKYSKGTGVIHISGAVEGAFVKISIKDNGQGIPKIEQSKIFNRFYRASNVKNNSSSGSGLGLYIVKSIVEQLHGDISFESEENVGTTFYVSLPVSE